ncbi:hypothetical protein SCB49_12064 [unidentified eubacterium SCB49]|nr:hypothetical protein SCB49_12064 [unidentified eubacterium SCB49]
MNIDRKLEKIEQDINNGLKLKASDRLRNLMNAYPNEHSLWNKLAELYYESGFLDAAGRYWILNEPTDDRIKKSVKAYTDSVNNSGYQILQEITYRGDKSKLSEYGQKKLLELEIDSSKKAGYVPKFSKKLNRKQRKKATEQNQTFKDRLFSVLIISILILIPILAIIGLITVAGFFFD